MPHYSDLYSLPSASGLCMPHYSSGLNYLSYSKPVPRYSHLYKPHLSTISEISLPYRRLNAPKHYPSDLTSRPIKTINTADIDVSVNKYKKFEKKGQQRLKAKEALPYTPEKPTVVKEAKPNPGIRRDRATVRLKTLHTDTLKEEIGNYRKWRDNFEPEELNKETKTQKKTKGELLKEKFLIRSRSKENIQALALENNKKNLIKRNSSFREICDAITCDTIDDELNPGQPEEIQRRQSKHQLSSENLLNDIRRVSAELTPEDLKVLNVMLASQASSVDSSDESFTLYEVEDFSKAQDETLHSLSPVETVTEHKEKSSALNKSEVLQTSSSENAVKEKENIKVSEKFTKPSLKYNKSDSLDKTEVKQAEINPIQSKPSKNNLLKDQKGKAVEKGNNATKDIQLKSDLNKFNKKLTPSPPAETKSYENKAKIDNLKKQIEITKLKQKNNLQPTKLNTNISENKENDIGNKPKDINPPTKEYVPRDISNVEIEQIKFKPKAVITASETSFDDIVTPKKTLIAVVVDDIDVEKSIIKKDKKLRFNVSVNIEQVKKKEGSKNKAISRSIKRGTAFHPIPQKTLLNNLIINKPKKYEHKELKELKLKKNNKIKESIPEKTKDLNIDQRASAELENKGESIELNKDKQPQNKLEVEALTDLNITKESQNKLDEESKIESVNKTGELFKDKEIEIKPATKVCNLRASLISKMPPKLTSKRSLIQKRSVKEDPDLTVFIPPPTPEPEPEPEKKDENVFVPLQSNRLSQWMHPWAKPEQYEECPVEIFARPKVIRGRHYPRGRKRNLPVLVQPVSNSVEDESDSDDSEDTEETSASLRSTDSGFGSTIPEKLNANGDNLQADAENETVDQEVEEFLTAVKKCGRIIPPATTIPRFKKYNVDDFDFMKVLGKGSFGKVLLAKLKETEYYYAVKCLKKDAIVEDDDVECTLIERKVLALGTKHPFLCHLLCTFQTESHLFFVMEYLNGGDLMFHITTTGCFPEDQARFYSAEVISGLQFLHSKGIIYRDLKLDNIILDFDGHVRLADFGMCKLEIFLDRMAESFCGTPDYMAPEIIKGQHYNQAVDWWSFGVLLYEMLLGQSPFSGCDEDELFWSICNEKPVFPQHLSTYSVDILKLLMEKDQAKRLGNRFCEHGPIREHNFYRSIDWADLEARRIEPPFKPYLVHPLDTQYFDTHFTKEAVKLTATEGPVVVTIDQSQFQGFSYTNPNACDK